MTTPSRPSRPDAGQGDAAPPSPRAREIEDDMGVGDLAPAGAVDGNGEGGSTADDPNASSERDNQDLAPGDERGEAHPLRGVRSYVLGFVAALLLTGASFGVAVAGKGFIYPPALPMVLVALAIGQMGVHLVFFLHLTTGPDNTNNVLALAFGTLIVGLVMVGSLWIMANLDATHHMAMDAAQAMRMRP